MATAEQILEDLFSSPRDPRSSEYRDGLLTELKFRLEGEGYPACPFELGTAQADAWFSGRDEGSMVASQIRYLGYENWFLEGNTA